MKKKLLIVEPGFQDYKEAIVKMLGQSSDVELYFATGLSAKVPSKWVEPYSSGSFEFSYVQNNLTQAVRAFESENGIRFDGALTYIETSVHFVNRLQHEMGWPVISLFTGKEIRSKAEMRKLFKARGVSQPEFQILEDGIAEISTLDFPIVVKPVEMMASLAVKKVTNPFELSSAVANASRADFEGEDLRALYGDISNQVLLEEFIEGPEYSVESLVVNGQTKILGVTEKSTTAAFDETGHTFPCTELSVTAMSRIEDLVFTVHNILKLQNTATHLEFKIKNEKPYLIEINCRQAGGLITELIRRSNYPKLGDLNASVALGRDFELSVELGQSQSICFFTSAVGGRLAKVPAAQNQLEVQMFYDLGAEIHLDPYAGLARIGFVMGPSLEVLEYSTQKSVQISAPVFHEDAVFKVQEVTLEQLETLSVIELAAWGEAQAASRESLQTRLQSPRGCSLQIAEKATGKIVGFCTALYASAAMDPNQSSWLDHAQALEKDGLDGLERDNLFIVSISVLPEAAKGAGAALLNGLERFALLQDIHSISYGARMTSVTQAENPSKDALLTYSKIQRGEVKEPSVQIGLKVGYRIESLLKNYFADPESLDFGILMTKRIE